MPPMPWRKPRPIVPLTFVGPFADVHLAWWLLKGHGIVATVLDGPDGHGRLEVAPGRGVEQAMLDLVAKITPSLRRHLPVVPLLAATAGSFETEDRRVPAA